MESCKIIKFGIFDDFSHQFKRNTITNILPLNFKELIVSTTEEILIIEKKAVKMRYPLKFSTFTIIPDVDLLIGITPKKGDFNIYQISDLYKAYKLNNSNVIKNACIGKFPTSQAGITHVFYSPKSNCIITIGSGIKVFNIQYKESDNPKEKPTISITKKSSFATSYASSSMTPPAFIKDAELILLPTESGIYAYSLSGLKVCRCSKYPASIKTIYATYSSKPNKNASLTPIPSSNIEKKEHLILSKKILTYDMNEGMNLWHNKGQLITHYDTIRSSVLSIIFIDDENAICINSCHILFYLNIKTGKTFYYMNLERNPTRLILTYIKGEPILCACFGSYLRALKLVIPWRVWNLNLEQTLSIRRYDRFMSAARILIDGENSFIKLYSPRDGSQLPFAKPKDSVHPVSYLYNRGIIESHIFNSEQLTYEPKIVQIGVESEGKLARDALYVALQNGQILSYDTSTSICEEVAKMNFKIAFMTVCRFHSIENTTQTKPGKTDNDGFQWGYAISSENGELFILDYFSMEEIGHFTVLDDTLTQMSFDFESDLIVMVFSQKTVLFDLEKGKIVDNVAAVANRVTSLFGNFLMYGYDSGHIRRIGIENKRFVTYNSENKVVPKEKYDSSMIKPHSCPITGFSFAQKVWISSGLDGNVILWNYEFNILYKIHLPLPLRSCLIMNGRCEILVATATEIMQIKNRPLLKYLKKDEKIDLEVKEIDNFDRFLDVLCQTDDDGADYASDDDDDIDFEFEEEKLLMKINKYMGSNDNPKEVVDNSMTDSSSNAAGGRGFPSSPNAGASSAAAGTKGQTGSTNKNNSAKKPGQGSDEAQKSQAGDSGSQRGGSSKKGRESSQAEAKNGDAAKGDAASKKNNDADDKSKAKSKDSSADKSKTATDDKSKTKDESADKTKDGSADKSKTKDGSADKSKDGSADKSKASTADKNKTKDGSADKNKTKDGSADKSKASTADKNKTKDGSADKNKTKDGSADKNKTKDGSADKSKADSSDKAKSGSKDKSSTDKSDKNKTGSSDKSKTGSSEKSGTDASDKESTSGKSKSKTKSKDKSNNNNEEGEYDDESNESEDKAAKGSKSSTKGKTKADGESKSKDGTGSKTSKAKQSKSDSKAASGTSNTNEDDSKDGSSTASKSKDNKISESGSKDSKVSTSKSGSQADEESSSKDNKVSKSSSKSDSISKSSSNLNEASKNENSSKDESSSKDEKASNSNSQDEDSKISQSNSRSEANDESSKACASNESSESKVGNENSESNEKVSNKNNENLENNENDENEKRKESNKDHQAAEDGSEKANQSNEITNEPNEALNEASQNDQNIENAENESGIENGVKDNDNKEGGSENQNEKNDENAEKIENGQNEDGSNKGSLSNENDESIKNSNNEDEANANKSENENENKDENDMNNELNNKDENENNVNDNEDKLNENENDNENDNDNDNIGQNGELGDAENKVDQGNEENQGNENQYGEEGQIENNNNNNDENGEGENQYPDDDQQQQQLQGREEGENEDNLEDQNQELEDDAAKENPNGNEEDNDQLIDYQEEEILEESKPRKSKKKRKNKPKESDSESYDFDPNSPYDGPFTRMPPPNVVLDKHELFKLYRKGRREFKPLVDEVRRENRIYDTWRNSLSYVQNMTNSITSYEEYRKQKQNHKGFTLLPKQPKHASSARAPRPNSNRNTTDTFITANSKTLSSTQHANSDNDNDDVTTSRQPPLPHIANKLLYPASYVHNYNNNFDTQSAIATPRLFGRFSSVDTMVEEVEQNRNQKMASTIYANSPKQKVQLPPLIYSQPVSSPQESPLNTVRSPPLASQTSPRRKFKQGNAIEVESS